MVMRGQIVALQVRRWRRNVLYDGNATDPDLGTIASWTLISKATAAFLPQPCKEGEGRVNAGGRERELLRSLQLPFAL